MPNMGQTPLILIVISHAVSVSECMQLSGGLIIDECLTEIIIFISNRPIYYSINISFYNLFKLNRCTSRATASSQQIFCSHYIGTFHTKTLVQINIILGKQCT